MVSFFFFLFGLFVTLGAAGLAALSDVRSFRIPNTASALVIAGFILAYVGEMSAAESTILPLAALKFHLLSFFAMFILTLLLFVTRIVGAGDAKFAAALALWLPIHPGLMTFVFYTSLIGGLMGIVTLFLKRVKPFRSAPAGTWLAAAQEGQNRLPYGLALSIGFILTLALMGFLNITEIINTVENSE